MGFFDSASEAIEEAWGTVAVAVGLGEEAKKVDPNKLEGPARTAAIEAKVKQDLEVQRCEQDLQISEQQLAHHKENLSDAEAASRDKQNGLYDAEKQKATAAYLDAEYQYNTFRNFKFDHGNPDKSQVQLDQLAAKMAEAEKRKQLIDNKDGWLKQHPLDQFVPAHFKEDVAAGEKNLHEMQARLAAARKAAWSRAEAAVDAPQRAAM